MTEKDLARKLHVPVRLIEKWENSEAVPSDRVIQKLNDLFGVDFWNYLDLDERHGGSHSLDDEEDRSPFEVLKAQRTEKLKQARQKKTSGQAWQGWQGKDFGQAGQVRSAKTKPNRSAGSTGSGKVITAVFAVFAAILILFDDFIFYDLLGMPELEAITVPLLLILSVLSAVIGRKRK